MAWEGRRLRSRMLIGYAIPVAVFLGLGLLVYSSTQKISEVFSHIEEDRIIQENTEQMTLGFTRMVEAFRGYFVFLHQDLLEEYNDAYILMKDKSRIIIDFEKSLEEEQRERLLEMIHLQDKFYKWSQRQLKLAQEGKIEEAVDIIREKQGKEYIDRFRILSIEFEKAQEKLLKRETAEARNAIAFLSLAVAIGIVGSIAAAITAALTISSSVVKTIEGSVSAIAASATEMAATVEEQERIAAQQAASINQTTTTMNELDSSSRVTAAESESSAESASQLLKLADASTKGAERVLKLAEGGKKTVGETLAEISALQQKVEEINAKILHLSEQTNQIGNVINIVSNLANQTNMLALNASVEAARAGENGKGFAVVASEIRKLADRSKASAEEINSLVLNIQGSINSTVRVTEEGKKASDSGIKLSRQTADAFMKVTEAIDEIILSNQNNSVKAIDRVAISAQQISQSANQQYVAIQQVVEAINALNQAAQESVNGISQTKAGIKQLNEAAVNLKAIV
ncbi:MAG: chemotaxis protein [Oscillatoria sp. SIO1A7]|nr:chemotaxis protein [Oscillatoria sp. SIO1A7]